MPVKGRKLEKSRSVRTAKPSKSGLKGDSQPLSLFRYENVNGRMARVKNPFPNPAPEEVLLRVFRGVEKEKFQTLEPRLREIELGNGDLRMFLVAGYFLAWLSLKKTGRKHRMPKLNGSFGELERAIPKLAALSRLSEEIRHKVENHDLPLELPHDLSSDQYLFARDVVLNAPEVFDLFRCEAETETREAKSRAHPLRETDEQLAQVEIALRPLRNGDYSHLYNSRWSLTAELVEAFGGKMSRKAIEKRTESPRFFSFLKRRSPSS